MSLVRLNLGCGPNPAAGWINFARELLTKAGFSSVASCAFQRTESAHAEIVALDNRPRETLFVEATK
jgi:hypothetical protein